MEMEAKLALKKWVSLSTLLGLLLFLLFIYFFAGIFNVASVIGGTNLLLYAAVFGAVLLSSVFDSLMWRSLLRNFSA